MAIIGSTCVSWHPQLKKLEDIIGEKIYCVHGFADSN